MRYEKEKVTRSMGDVKTYGVYVDLSLDEIKAVRKQSDLIGIKMSDYIRMSLADIDVFKTRAPLGTRLFDSVEDERLNQLKEHLRKENIERAMNSLR